MMDFIYEYKRFFTTAVVGLVVVIIISLSRGIFSAESSTEVMTILSDACFIPGVVLLGVGILMAVANEGLFNGMIFGLKTIGRSLTAKKEEKIREEDFHEYNARVNAKKSKVSHLIVVGIVYIVFSILFAVLYVCI